MLAYFKQTVKWLFTPCLVDPWAKEEAAYEAILAARSDEEKQAQEIVDARRAMQSGLAPSTVRAAYPLAESAIAEFEQAQNPSPDPR